VHRIDSSRKRFIIAYLEAVLEHHADECVFEKRDAFVKMWKGNSFDFFSLKAGQKKIMKGEMKRLKAEFEIELDSLKDSMRSEQYEERVAKFVGSLVPGRQDQKRGGGGGVNWLYALNQSHDMNNDEQNEQNAREDSAVDMETGLEENKLLEALKVPRAAKDWEGNVNGKAKNAICLNTVVESGVAIEAVKITTAKDIMEMLVGRFG
jgi:hypothetical protein